MQQGFRFLPKVVLVKGTGNKDYDDVTKNILYADASFTYIQ